MLGAMLRARHVHGNAAHGIARFTRRERLMRRHAVIVTVVMMLAVLDDGHGPTPPLK
jgi:hypothetical protein